MTAQRPVPDNQTGPYEWDWFNDHTRPHGGSYGVKHADGTIHCLTNSYKDGYEKAVEIAAAMNATLAANRTNRDSSR